MTAIFDTLQRGYDYFGRKHANLKSIMLHDDAAPAGYDPNEHIWAHYAKGILVGHERRKSVYRKMHATWCEEINKPTESMTMKGQHKMYDHKGRNVKCLEYHDNFAQAKLHATREVEYKCSDTWALFQQSLVKQDQKEALKRGTPQEWFQAGIDMYLRTPRTRAEKIGRRYAPGMVPPPYTPKDKVGESLGDTLGDEVAKRFRILSVCMLRDDFYEHLRDEQISQQRILPISEFDAQQKMVEGRGGKEKMSEVLLELRVEKQEAIRKGEHWGTREYKTWKDVADFPQGYTREIFERRRLKSKDSEFDP